MRRTQLMIGVIAILHLIGIVGLSSQWSEQFVYLTPLHLLSVLFVLLAGQVEFSRGFWIYFGAITVLSFGVEVLGVQSGVIFGEYAYGEVLGPGVLGTPFIIGVNWFILLFAIGATLTRFDWHPIIKSVAGAAVMLIMDIIIEPVAIQLGFWEWEEVSIPLRNYMAWFAISFVFLLPFNYSRFRKANTMAEAILIMQALFFLTLNAIRMING